MKKFSFILFSALAITACSQIEKPDHLISKDEMAEIIMESTLYDNSSYLNPSNNMETTSKLILEKHKVTGKQFADSYKYYLVNKDIDKILDKAKEKLVELDPKAQEYIDKKDNKNKQETNGSPATVEY
ncbi:DUF4296 domain-containing protein [Elizabethkingia sp. JS20170427COW]|uniref:DUF4296 domain-containing protein n=1 Tax=Elizabethkingia sp. JS20170427COW TaxID=2583851 RepID=UPI001110A51E|nr:DUF4296 domain-containing protein [Elizabethkingia sp. JS20170427COW]QCX53019.1 DUF4296 domain-containing protein [Elizabethkingia sp. JS20170427COW]